MNVALDTNAYGDFMRGVAARVEVVRTATRLFLPLFVLGELRAGFAAGNQQTTNETNLDRFLASPRVTVLLPVEATPGITPACFWSCASKARRFRPTTSGSRPWRNSTS